MTKKEIFLNKIAVQVLSANIFLFVCVFFLFMLQGFTSGELSEILKILAPIKAIYITAIIKYIIDNKNSDSTQEADSFTLSELYKTITKLIIYSHIFLIYSLVILVAINLISFQDFKTVLAIVETFFGGYIGLLISDMFKTDAKQK